MKKQFIGFLVLLSFVFSVAAQKAQTQKTDAGEKNLRTHVEYLASDKLEGRRTGETGATYAAGYVAGLFANYKLKAGFTQTLNGKKNVNYLQTFPFVTGVEMADAGNSFSLDVSAMNGQRLTYDDKLAFKPIGFSPNGSVSDAPVVFVGYGIVSDELKFDDYKFDGKTSQNINGKIAVAFDGSPENDTPHSPFNRFDALAKALIAKQKGAIGLLLISRQANLEDDRLAQLKYDQTLGEAALPTIVVSRKTGADMLGTDENGLQSLEKIETAKKDSPLPVTIANRDVSPLVSFKINLVKKQSDAYNVVGILEGTDSVLKNEAIVIGAHYDHLGHGGQGSLDVNSKEIHHGADDNASGVAAMLELARQFAQEKKNKRTIIFIAFGGEEEGLLGSQFYVKNPAFPIAKTVAMINMDMVGRLKDDKLTVGGIGTASEWKSLIESINNKNMMPVSADSQMDAAGKAAVEDALRKKGFNYIYVEARTDQITLKGAVPKGKMAEAVMTTIDVAKRKVKNEMTESDNLKLRYEEIFPSTPFVLQLNDDGFGPSDHSSFYAQKVPVLFFFTGTHDDYHKPSDTADKINYTGLLKVKNYVAEIVKAIDQNPTKPTYTVAKSSNNGTRMGFSVSLGTVPNYADGNDDGLLLDGVRDDSPAAKAGIKANDKIVKLAGRDIRNISDYTFVLGELKAGTEYEVEVMRGAERLTLKIVPAARK